MRNEQGYNSLTGRSAIADVQTLVSVSPKSPRVKRPPHRNADLRKGNTFLRSRTGAALGVVRDAAVHRLLDAGTETTSGRAGVKTRPQNSHVVKLERCAKLTVLKRPSEHRGTR
jgi:hypothetical protein